jgi:hypothetical protein
MQTKNPYFPQQILGILVSAFYKVWSSTFRYQVVYEDLESLKEKSIDIFAVNPQKNNVIFAFWHQDELALLPLFHDLKVVAMVSLSKDGTIMSTALEQFGYQPVRGSSHRGGLAAFIAGLKKVKTGFSFTMAVDGPKGPIYKVKEGIIAMSQKSGRPILPVRAYPERFFLFKKAWNQARLPLPFSKIKIKVGKCDDYQRASLETYLRGL